MKSIKLKITEEDLIKNFRLYEISPDIEEEYEKCKETLDKLIKNEYKEKIYLAIMNQDIEERDEMFLSAISQSRLDCNKILDKFQKDHGN